MKFAVLADIHGNYPALQTVVEHIEGWQPDEVIVAGDIVNRGPSPVDCLNLIRKKQASEGWRVVRGNHEEYVIGFADPESTFSKIEYDIFQCSYWTYEQLGKDLSSLREMPFSLDISAESVQPARVLHASMAGSSDGVFPFTTDSQLAGKILTSEPSPPSLFCVAHTHFPLMRCLNQIQVVNVGAVGMPFDGDHRAAYGQFTWRNNQWSAEIVRLDYDRQQAEKNFKTTGFLEEAGPVSKLILDELRTAQSRLFQWTMEYQTLTLAGKITVEESVARFLEKIKAN